MFILLRTVIGCALRVPGTELRSAVQEDMMVALPRDMSWHACLGEPHPLGFTTKYSSYCCAEQRLGPELVTMASSG